ncbi:MAG: hypothetical protein KIT22_19575, partial [Verrucomicrobiae bacterium]|nr:hypothetical protein [Verrucomicrobiae bacterium]
MTTPTQRLLPLRIDERVALLDANTVCASLGIDPEGVAERVDSGDIRWAFDISCGTRLVRELRIWRACLVEAEAAGQATLEDVIRDVIGGLEQDAEVRAARIEKRWLVSTQTVRRHRLAGEISGRLSGHTL